MALGFRRNSLHWRSVAISFLLDAALVWISFILGIWVRFGLLSFEKLMEYGPGVGLASIAMPSLFYIGGFYSARGPEGGFLTHLRWFCFGLLGVALAILAMGSIDFSSRVGRGVFLAGMSLLTVLLLLRHLVMFRGRNLQWKTILCLVTDEEDEAAAALLEYLWGDKARLLGVISASAYQSRSDLPIVGTIDSILEEGLQVGVEVMLVRDQHLADPEYGSMIRRLRYQGVEIVSLADACEEAYHAVPLGLITDSWLFRASNQAGLFYIKKLKRLFDVVAALVFLILLSPFLALGAMIVRAISPGPILFRQSRAGRLGRPITVLKLRTMHPDSEKEGAQWSGEVDPRVIPMGRFLRRFRIDEIPQLINVLRGDMSFVGPRPEQLDLIEELDAQVPFYRERLLIQPGLTGWAQVRYPYGGTVEGAARKLEYDLYYMKHMSVLLDCFILLETVKIILRGGVNAGGDREYHRFRKSVAFPSGAGPSSEKEAGERDGESLAEGVETRGYSIKHSI